MSSLNVSSSKSYIKDSLYIRDFVSLVILLLFNISSGINDIILFKSIFSSTVRSILFTLLIFSVSVISELFMVSNTSLNLDVISS